MNLLSITIEVRGGATIELLRRLGSRRRELNEMIGEGAALITRTHLAQIAQTRHKTATALGANPTGHFKEAAESVNVAASGAGAELRISHRGGLTRAVRDVRILPTGGRRALTLPIHALAYGRRVKEVERELGQKLFRPYYDDGKRAGALAARAPGGELLWLYALRSSTFQKQDRSLLPSDEEYQVAGSRAITGFLEIALQEATA